MQLVRSILFDCINLPISLCWWMCVYKIAPFLWDTYFNKLTKYILDLVNLNSCLLFSTILSLVIQIWFLKRYLPLEWCCLFFSCFFALLCVRVYFIISREMPSNSRNVSLFFSFSGYYFLCDLQALNFLVSSIFLCTFICIKNG